jgi:hypothetical protein
MTKLRVAGPTPYGFLAEQDRIVQLTCLDLLQQLVTRLSFGLVGPVLR